MNRDDIIRMAREAEFHVTGQRVLSPVIGGGDLTWLLERFATLVAAAAVEREREACAKVADENAAYWAGYKIAAAIRARGQA